MTPSARSTKARTLAALTRTARPIRTGANSPASRRRRTVRGETERATAVASSVRANGSFTMAVRRAGVGARRTVGSAVGISGLFWNA
jgi:hypothetical protein